MEICFAESNRYKRTEWIRDRERANDTKQELFAFLRQQLQEKARWINNENYVIPFWVWNIRSILHIEQLAYISIGFECVALCLSTSVSYMCAMLHEKYNRFIIKIESSASIQCDFGVGKQSAFSESYDFRNGCDQTTDDDDDVLHAHEKKTNIS